MKYLEFDVDKYLIEEEIERKEEEIERKEEEIERKEEEKRRL